MSLSLPGSVLALLLLSVAASATTFPVTDTDVEGTYYYDIGGEQACIEAQNNNAEWSVGPNSGPTACEQAPHIRNLAETNSNRIVAIRDSLFGNDPDSKANICGNEVKVYDASGKEIVLDEGPFYVWDRCMKCDSGESPTGLTRLDLSAKALVQANGGSCKNMPTGLRYEILPNKIRNWPWDGQEWDTTKPGTPGNSSATAPGATSSPSTPTTTPVPDAGQDEDTTPEAPASSSASTPGASGAAKPNCKRFKKRIH